MKMTKFLTRNYSFLGVSLMMELWSDLERCTKITGIPDAAHDIEFCRSVWWLDDTWIDSISQKYLTAEVGLFRSFILRGREVGDKLSSCSREFYETITSVKTVLSAKNLQDFITWLGLFQDNATFILITHPLAKSVEISLLDVLKKSGVPMRNLDQALLDLSITRRSNAAEEENFDLFLIQKKLGKQDFDVESALKEHTRKHAFLKYREPFSGGYTIDYFRNRLKTPLELPNYFQPYADIIEQFNNDEKELAEILEEFVFYRTYRTERSYEALYYLENYLSGLEAKHGLGLHELSWYLKEELIHFLESGKRVEPAKIQDRKNGFAFLLHNKSVSLQTGHELVQWANQRFIKSSLPVGEVRGLAAYRGNAIGKARVILTVDDQEAVCEGEILITHMTTPDFLPGMQKAVAFVTDEGGVICHAAIIAREMKKPCVIGTKTATTVFKNGDLIEVNGVTGVVRLVSE
jgi:phosphohistidine swiveling domain-containing protein